MIIRQPPPPGALDKYAVNIRPNPLGALGIRRGRRATRREATAAAQQRTVLPAAGSDTDVVELTEASAAVKEYFDVGVYRNILDMLNTFQGVNNRWGQSLAKELRCVNSQGYVKGGWCSPVRDPHSTSISQPFSIGKSGCFLQAAVGYAASKIGPKNKAEARMYADQQIQAAGVPAGDPGFFQVPDLLNLARTINYEMNRVRLPIPHNFRQIANAIQGRDYRLCPEHLPALLPPRPAYEQWRKQGGRGWLTRAGEQLSQNYINAVELLPVYKNLKTAINTMRVAVRKEIDAANLARKVEEQTIRREQEELISREQAAREAEARELEILAEKRAAYEKEMEEAAKLAEEAAAAKAELAAELEQLQAAREAAQTEQEVQAVEEKAAEVISARELAEQMEQDMAVNFDTSRQAAASVNEQMFQVQGEAAPREGWEELPPQKKPMNLAPILLTAAAGLLLT